MNAKLAVLAERRALLVAKAASQRTELAQAVAPWRKPLALVDQGVRVIRSVGSHPVLLAGGLVFALLLRPRRVLGWLRNGWLLWRAAASVKRRLSG